MTAPSIIPAILTQDEADFRRKIQILRPLNTFIHIDVMDGVFVPRVTFNDLPKLKGILTDQSRQGQGFEAHLMVLHPLEAVDGWLGAGARRILFHLESKDDPRLVIERVREYPKEVNRVNKVNKVNKEVGIVLNPETPWQKIEPHIKDLDVVMFMGVHPGKSGQEFVGETLEKIRAFHEKYPAMPIEVDGGVTLDNAAELVKAGVSQLAAASAIFKERDPLKAFQAFQDMGYSV